MPTIDHNINFDKLNLSIKNHIEKNKIAYVFVGGIAVGFIVRGRENIQMTVNVLPK